MSRSRSRRCRRARSPISRSPARSAAAPVRGFVRGDVGAKAGQRLRDGGRSRSRARSRTARSTGHGGAFVAFDVDAEQGQGRPAADREGDGADVGRPAGCAEAQRGDRARRPAARTSTRTVGAVTGTGVRAAIGADVRKHGEAHRARARRADRRDEGSGGRDAAARRRCTARSTRTSRRAARCRRRRTSRSPATSTATSCASRTSPRPSCASTSTRSSCRASRSAPRASQIDHLTQAGHPARRRHPRRRQPPRRQAPGHAAHRSEAGAVPARCSTRWSRPATRSASICSATSSAPGRGARVARHQRAHRDRPRAHRGAQPHVGELGRQARGQRDARPQDRRDRREGRRQR